jgi:hypothetical protein
MAAATNGEGCIMIILYFLAAFLGVYFSAIGYLVSTR